MKKLIKKILFIILFPTLLFGQVQIGEDIDGESMTNYSGSGVSLSSDGNILAIGAYYNSDNGERSGHVRVYENIAGSWIQIGQDIDGENAFDQSGNAISLSNDGNILAIGAHRNGGNGTYSGHVRVYENLAGNWVQIGNDINGENQFDQSGFSVSLSNDGSILAIGAPFNDGSASNSGHVRVYENIANNWIQIGNDIDGESSDDESGYSVSLSSNGNIVAIGAVENDGNGTNSGHVRVYENIAGNWIQIGNDIDGESYGDLSGNSVSLSSDGIIIAIGAFHNDGDGNGTRVGHVRIYENIAGNWTQIGNDIDGENVLDESGNSVVLSNEGNIVAIGTRYGDNGDIINSGHVRIYKNIAGNWVKLGNNIHGENENDLSGIRISLSDDNTKIAIGAIFNDGNGEGSGHVRVYNLSELLSISDNISLKESTIVYPNPTSNNLTIQLNENFKLEKVILYNSLGQIITINNNNNIIDVSTLDIGTYYLKMIINGDVVTKKIIVE